VSRPLNIGILAYTHLHVPRYLASIVASRQAELAGIADFGVNREAGRAAAAEHDVPFFETYEELLDLEDVDAVVLGMEPVYHREAVAMAAQRGVHVLCDKPIATTMEDAAAIVETAAAAGIKLMVSFFPRFQLPLIKVKEELDSGEAGDVVAIYAVKYGRLPTKAVGPQSAEWFLDPSLSGGGGFMDIGIHALDALRWLAGAEPRSIHATVGTMLHDGLDNEDFGVATIEFDNGVVASLSAGWANPDWSPTWLDVKFEILTTKKVFLVDKPHHDLAVYTNDSAQRVGWLKPETDKQIAAFVDSIVEDREPPITGEDGVAALALVLAAYESSRTGRKVDVPRAADRGT
jgi:predicted dehydrogenase